MIWPSVPQAQISPDAVRLSTPAPSRVGRLRDPSMTMVAPMIPVEAAIRAETTTTESASAERVPPNSRLMLVSIRSACRERSSSTPTSTNSGTAMSSVFSITPKTRCGTAWK